MKVLTVVGARPQFVKCAPVSRALRKVADEILVHTGQHYDENMSEVFFRELEIPKPDYNLGVGSGRHGEQTGEMLKRIEEVLIKECPDTVLVYGDTNSTLAGALAAVKLNLPVAHVEAGLRSFNRTMPEEINRVATDHLARLLFCPSAVATKNLAQEGLTAGVHCVGDVMYDALLFNVKVSAEKCKILDTLGLRGKEYFLATVHRAENTDQPDRLGGILSALNRLAVNRPIVWPVHPRTRKVLEAHAHDLRNHVESSLRIIDPVSYLDMLALEKEAGVILTDSGGVQKEAFWLGVPCVTLRDETEWTETVELGWNTIVGTQTEAICTAALERTHGSINSCPYGNGKAADAIVSALVAA